jgi:hypothetical protein
MTNRALTFCCLLLLGACERGDVGRAGDTAPPVAPVAGEARTMPLVEVWPGDDAAPVGVQRERSFDLTGDGIAERVRVVARGQRYDSLDIALSVETVAGDTLWLDRWNSAAYFKYRPRADMDEATAAGIVRAHVDSLLHESRFSEHGLPAPLRRGSVAHVPDESIAYHLAELDWRNAASLEPRDPTPPEAHDRISARPVVPERVRAVRQELEARPVFMYYAGGEATYALAWSVREHAFVRLYSCC